MTGDKIHWLSSIISIFIQVKLLPGSDLRRFVYLETEEGITSSCMHTRNAD